jgi:hypothetical protein
MSDLSINEDDDQTEVAVSGKTQIISEVITVIQVGTSPSGNGSASGKKETEIRGRKSNFSKAQDMNLVLSYMDISQDPISGTDQRHSTFWEKINVKYHTLEAARLMKKVIELSEEETRTTKALENRFGVISKTCQEFTGCVEEVRSLKISGLNAELEMEKAMQLFKGRFKGEFKFNDLWMRLRQLPKWATAKKRKTIAIASSSSGDIKSSSSSTGPIITINDEDISTTSASIIGSKQAKRLRQDEDEEIKVAKAKIEVTQKVADAMWLKQKIKLFTTKTNDLDDQGKEFFSMMKTSVLDEMKKE